MSDKTYDYLITLIGVICGYVILRHLFFYAGPMSLRNDVVQGFFTGFGLAVVTIEITARVKVTKVNGWTTLLGCGRPGSGILMRAACIRVYPGPVNAPQEAVYWKTDVDGAGHTLSGQHDYILRFPPGGLPPNDAFWSLTMADDKERFVANPLDRYCLGDRSGLEPNADGSVDIYIQSAAPAGHESNWLPTPLGGFRLWLRAYQPGEAILNGAYTPPPVVEVT